MKEETRKKIVDIFKGKECNGILINMSDDDKEFIVTISKQELEKANEQGIILALGEVNEEVEPIKGYIAKKELDKRENK